MKSAQEERTKKRNEVNTRVMTDLRRATRVFFFFFLSEKRREIPGPFEDIVYIKRRFWEPL